MTAVEWLAEKYNEVNWLRNRDEISSKYADELREVFFYQAKEMEQTNTDNKVIHFAEWLTKKHTYTLITLYEHFEEEHYGDK
jgi:hypothetical protein